jgi:DNA-binding transcriptional LysR family regulator
MAFTFQQLHCIRQVVAHHFSVSRTAEALSSTQPGVSKLIRALEAELGVDIFVRRGNRLVGLTDAGKEAYALAGRVLRDAESLQRLKAASHSPEIEGVLRVGTTHIHARYHLLSVTDRFVRAYPKVRLEYSVGTPAEIYQRVRDGTLDVGLSTLPEATPSGILAIKAYDIHRCLVVPAGHPLLDVKSITIEELMKWSWIVHDERFTSGAVVHHAFRKHGMQPRIVMRAMDVSIMKAYVARGIGIAVMQKVALEDETDGRLCPIDVDHLFPSSSAMVTLRSDHLLTVFAFDFIQMLLPHMTPDQLAAALGPGAAGVEIEAATGVEKF